MDPATGERPEHACKGRWVGTLEAGLSPRGTRRRLPVYGRSKAEVKAKLVEKQRAIARDGIPTASTTLTVQRWAEKWLDAIVHTQRPKSFGTTKGSINKWVVPTIGRQRLDRLTRAHLRAVQDAQRQAGRSSATLRRTHTVLVKMLKDAQAEGHPVPANVLSMPAPEVGESDRAALTPEHLAKMLVENRPRYMEAKLTNEQRFGKEHRPARSWTCSHTLQQHEEMGWTCEGKCTDEPKKGA